MKKNMPLLTPRLRLVRELVRPGKRAADIGADHAHLAICLVNSGKTPFCIASDLRPGPLKKAAAAVERYRAGEKIELRLSNGLDGFSEKDNMEDIVMAGMGGELIAGIISRCDFLQTPKINLVLQPMSSQDFLRRSLYRAGFAIAREAVVKEGFRFYTVMTVSFTGVERDVDDAFSLIGRLPENGDPVSNEYIRLQAEKLQKKAAGLRMARDASRFAEAEAAEKTAARIAAFL